MTPTQLFNLGVISRQQRIVLSGLKRRKACNRALSLDLGLPINIITARVNELRKKGYVKPSGCVYDTYTNRTVQVWEVITIPSFVYTA